MLEGPCQAVEAEFDVAELHVIGLPAHKGYDEQMNEGEETDVGHRRCEARNRRVRLLHGFELVVAHRRRLVVREEGRVRDHARQELDHELEEALRREDAGHHEDGEGLGRILGFQKCLQPEGHAPHGNAHKLVKLRLHDEHDDNGHYHVHKKDTRRLRAVACDLHAVEERERDVTHVEGCQGQSDGREGIAKAGDVNHAANCVADALHGGLEVVAGDILVERARHEGHTPENLQDFCKKKHNRGEDNNQHGPHTGQHLVRRLLGGLRRVAHRLSRNALLLQPHKLGRLGLLLRVFGLVRVEMRVHPRLANLRSNFARRAEAQAGNEDQGEEEDGDEAEDDGVGDVLLLRAIHAEVEAFAGALASTIRIDGAVGVACALAGAPSRGWPIGVIVRAIARRANVKAFRGPRALGTGLAGSHDVRRVLARAAFVAPALGPVK
mmetsp:Transcript_35451/g.111561  ORF Transcript_35451/g.111561 Transcript_35451/m.111561 type:complete len:438 (-) Transcript_35451:1446-2759(-)